MGVKDGFMGASVLMKVVLILLLVANLFNWMGFCTSSWGYAKNVASQPGVGLWRSCSDAGERSDCNLLEGTRSDWYAAVQTFGIFGFTSINVACLLVILFLMVGACKGNGEVKMAAIILCFVAVVCWLIAVVIFGATYPEFRVAGIDYRFGFSFALAIVSFILVFIAGILLIVDGVKGGGTSPA